MVNAETKSYLYTREGTNERILWLAEDTYTLANGTQVCSAGTDTTKNILLNTDTWEPHEINVPGTESHIIQVDEPYTLGTTTVRDVKTATAMMTVRDGTYEHLRIQGQDTIIRHLRPAQQEGVYHATTTD